MTPASADVDKACGFEFSVDKLKSALEEERAERFLRNEKRKERRSKNGVVELVREAERRRDMMSGRLGLQGPYVGLNIGHRSAFHGPRVRSLGLQRQLTGRLLHE